MNFHLVARNARDGEVPMMNVKRRHDRERGTALAMVVVFTLLAVASALLFLERTHVELADSKLKAASVRDLFKVNAALQRAHSVINEETYSSESAAINENAALVEPEVVDGISYVQNTNHAVRVRTVKPSDAFDDDGYEIAPSGGYTALPDSWYVLEARMFEPIFTRPDGVQTGVLKVVRQYVRDGTPLSNNFVAVIEDDLGLGGSAVNPGKPAEGEIQTNKHLYIMTPNPYYANRLLAVTGVSYTAGASEAGTVYLHPDNNFAAQPLYLPLPTSLTSNPSDPNDTLKAHALGSSPTTVSLVTTNPTYTVTMGGGGVTGASSIAASGDGNPTIKLNMVSGQCRGVCVDGNVDSQVTYNTNGLMTVRITKAGDSSKWIQVANLPVPQNGVVFFDTHTSNAYSGGGVTRRTKMSGVLRTRTTMATTGNVDVVGSVKYEDTSGDKATKFVYTSALSGVDEANYGTVAEIPDTTILNATTSCTYMANKRPPGTDPVSGDGFYDGDAVLGVVAAQDVILCSTIPQNGEIAGAYLSLQKRLTLEGLTYNSSGALTSVSGTNPFYVNNGGRSSIRRFGSLVSDRRPCTTVVTSTGAFYYGFKRGFSLFDEDMKQKPPPFFPKDKKPQYLGWSLKDLGVRAMN